MQSTRYESLIFSTYFRKTLKHKTSWKSLQWEPSCSLQKNEQTDRYTDVTKLIVAFRSFANAPRNGDGLPTRLIIGGVAINGPGCAHSSWPLRWVVKVRTSYRGTTLCYVHVVSVINFLLTAFNLLLSCWIKTTEDETDIIFPVTLKKTATQTFNSLPEVHGENDTLT